MIVHVVTTYDGPVGVYETETDARERLTRLARESCWIVEFEVIESSAIEEWRLDLDAVLDAKGRVPLSLNDRLHWAAKATKVDRVKNATRNAVMAAAIPHLAHVHVEMYYRPKTNRFRDVDNTVATMKPIIDALHTPDKAANHPVPFDPIVDGDDPRYLTWSPPVLHPWEKGKPASLWLILRSVG